MLCGPLGFWGAETPITVTLASFLSPFLCVGVPELLVHAILQGQGNYSFYHTAQEGAEAGASPAQGIRSKIWVQSARLQTQSISLHYCWPFWWSKDMGGLALPALRLFSPTPNLLLRVMSSAEAAVSVVLLLTLGEAGLGNSDSVLSREGEGQQSSLAISWQSSRVWHDSKLVGRRTCSLLPMAVWRLCPHSRSLGRYFWDW